MANMYHLRPTTPTQSDSGFTIGGGAGSITTALSDNSVGTYITKPLYGSGGYYLLQSIKDPSAVTGGVAVPISGHYLQSCTMRVLLGSTSGFTGVIRSERNGSVQTALSVSGTYSIPSTITTVTNATRTTGGVITVTTAAAHGRAVNDLIRISSSSTGTPAGWVNGSYRILTTPTSTSFTAQDVSAYSGFTAISGGSAATNGNIALASNASTPANTTFQYVTGTNAQTLINDFAFGYWDLSDAINYGYVYEVWFEVVTGALPTVTVTGIDSDTSSPYVVTTTSRPTVTWTHAQADSQAQTNFRVKVFTSATTDPDTSTTGLVYDSGIVKSSLAEHQITTDLVNSTTYYVYVKTNCSSTSSPDDGWSLWGSGTASSFITFTTSFTAPDAPYLNLSWDSANQRVSIVCTGKAVTAPMTAQTYDVQRSDDGGTTWYYIRGGTGLVPDGSYQVTHYDYEMERNNTAYYRARSVATGANNTISSPWNDYVLFNFEANVTGWTAGTNTTVSQSSTQAYAGTYSMRLAPTASGNVSATYGTSTTTAVVVGGTYKVDAYFRSTSASRSASINLKWYTSGASLISTTSGTGTSTTTSGWTLVTVSGTAPATSAYVIVEVAVASAGSSSDYQYVDNLVFSLTDATVSIPAVTNWVMRSLSSTGQLNLVNDVKVLGALPLKQEEDLGVFRPLGRDSTVVLHGSIRGEDGTYQIYADNQTTFEELKTVFNSRAVILVVDPYNNQKYIHVINRSYDKVGFRSNSPIYQMGIEYVETESGLVAN